MEQSRLPRAYLALLAVALLQFGFFVVVAHTRVKPAGAAIYALLLWRLARGGAITWTLLLVANFLLVSLTTLGIGSGGAGVLWSNVAMIVIPSLTMVCLLLSAAMRRHVGIARTQPSY